MQLRRNRPPRRTALQWKNAESWSHLADEWVRRESDIRDLGRALSRLVLWTLLHSYAGACPDPIAADVDASAADGSTSDAGHFDAQAIDARRPDAATDAPLPDATFDGLIPDTPTPDTTIDDARSVDATSIDASLCNSTELPRWR